MGNRMSSSTANEQLFDAVQRGNLKDVRALIRKGADVHAVDPRDDSKLTHEAARFGHVEVLEYLLTEGLDINSTDEHDLTPLHLASLNGRVEATRFLVDNGADVRAKSFFGQMPIHVAAEHGQKGILQMLLATGQDINEPDEPPLFLASENGHVDVVQFLVDSGADVHAKSFSGEMPIHVAAKYSHKSIVQILLATGQDVNEPDLVDFTPLFIASENGHVDVAQFLVDNGADVHAKSFFGDMPIHVAAEHGQIGVVQILLATGQDINEPNEDDLTPLHLASKFGRIDVVQFLVDNNADVLAESNEGQKPLHCASLAGHQNIVEILLKKMNNVDETDKRYQTPLHLASKYGYLDIVQFLVDHRADVHAQTVDGQKPIHLAAWSGIVDLVKYLVNQGNVVDVTDFYEFTPLHMASARGHLDIVQFLVQQSVNVNAFTKMILNPRYYRGLMEYSLMIYPHFVNDVYGRFDDSQSHTPLHLATWCDQLKVATFLINNYADVNAQSHFGCTALHYAAYKGHIDMVKYLLTVKGINIDSQNNKGCTALHMASQTGRSLSQKQQVVQCLLEAGARSDVKNNNDHTALFYYIKDLVDLDDNDCGSDDAIRNYLETGSYFINEEQRTPAHFALVEGFSKIVRVKLVLQNQVDFLNKEDVYGNTPLNYLTDETYPGSNDMCLELIRFLVDHGAFLKQNDSRRIVANISQRKELFKDVAFCTKAIINRFNNRDLPTLYAMLPFEELPPFERMKIRSTQVQRIERAVGKEIENRGYCNVSTMMPVSLVMLCVNAFISRHQ